MNGERVSLEIAAQALAFVFALPADVPRPEVALEPDGSLALDWMVARRRSFSLSVGRSNRLPYAWIDGAEGGHGVETFDGETIPAGILALLRRITGP